MHEIDVVLNALNVEHRISRGDEEQTVADGSTMIRAVVGGGAAK